MAKTKTLRCYNNSNVSHDSQELPDMWRYNTHFTYLIKTLLTQGGPRHTQATQKEAALGFEPGSSESSL